MKKLMAALLAACMLVTLCIPVFAEGEESLIGQTEWDLAKVDSSTKCNAVERETTLFLEKFNNGKPMNWYDEIFTINSITCNAMKEGGNLKDYFMVDISSALKNNAVFSSGDSDNAVYTALNGLNGYTVADPAETKRFIAIRVAMPAGAVSAEVYVNGADLVSKEKTSYYGHADNFCLLDDSANGAKDVCIYQQIAEKSGESWKLTLSNYEDYRFDFKDADGNSVYVCGVNVVIKSASAPWQQPIRYPDYRDVLDGSVTAGNGYYSICAGTAERPNEVQPNVTFTKPHHTGGTNADGTATNGGTLGYWVGMLLKVPDGLVGESPSAGSVPASIQIKQGADPESMEVKTSDSTFSQYFLEGGDEGWYVDAYTTARDMGEGTPAFKPYVSVDWDGAGTDYEPVWYKFDLTNVKLPAETTVKDDAGTLPSEVKADGGIAIVPDKSVQDSNKKDLVIGGLSKLDDVGSGKSSYATAQENIKKAPQLAGLALSDADNLDKSIAPMDLKLNVTPLKDDGTPGDTPMGAEAVNEYVGSSPITVDLAVPSDLLDADATNKELDAKKVVLAVLNDDDSIELLSDQSNVQEQADGKYKIMGVRLPHFSTYAFIKLAKPYTKPAAPVTPDKPATQDKPSYTYTPDNGDRWLSIDNGGHGVVTPGSGYQQGATTFVVSPDKGWTADYALIDGKTQIAIQGNRFTLNVTEPLNIQIFYKEVAETTAVEEPTLTTENPQTGDNWFARLFF